MGLVTAKEVAKTIKTDKYGVLGTFSGWLLMKVLKISTLNKIYDRNKHLSEVPFLNAILDEFQIKFEIPEDDLKRLPKDGAYITISNHPLGGIDGILLLKLMLEQEQQKLMVKQQELENFEPEMTRKLQMYQQQYMEPILERTQKAIAIVAERKKLNYK